MKNSTDYIILYTLLARVKGYRVYCKIWQLFHFKCGYGRSDKSDTKGIGMHEEEIWAICPDFPNYQVSSLGRVARSDDGRPMSVSYTQFGHAKITLVSEPGIRVTRSVAVLVAKSFVERLSEDSVCVIAKNLNYSDLRPSNLEWRPEGFAWSYINQFKRHPPLHYQNLEVMDVTNQIVYPNIIEAALDQGLLFPDIWRSTYTGEEVFPTKSIFRVTERRV